ncbi:MAG: hypothetical protein H6974_03245 [Gammaproteobacteria bacterium]|nr:hypothetical protein [Gammaproteobacteria bacterium]
MNVPGTGSSFDFRRIEPKQRITPKLELAQKQAEPQTQLSLVSAGSDSKLSATSTVNPQSSDLSTESAERLASDEIAETDTDESISENSPEWPDDLSDPANDYELAADEYPEHDDDQEKEQHQRKGNYLDALETCYRSRFIVLNNLLDRITASDHFLRQQMGNYP